MAHDAKSLDKVIPLQAWGLRDKEAAEVDRLAGRLAPERYADRPYRGGGEVPVGDMSRVFRAGYVVGWAGSRPTWDNPYRPETPYGRLWRDGYESGWRTRIEAGRRDGEGVLP